MKNKNNRPWRVIIDTNIWISFLIGKHLAGLHRHINSGQVKIVTCKMQLQELVDVLNRPRIRKYIYRKVKRKNFLICFVKSHSL